MGSGWDVHVHVIPPGVAAAGKRREAGTSVDDGHLFVGGPSAPTARLPLRRLADIDGLWQELRARGHDGALVSVPPFLFRYDLAPADAAAWCRLVNDSLAELHRPGLRPLACLPLQSPEHAVAELGRLRGGPFAGLSIGSTVGDVLLDDQALEPVLAAANAAAAFVLVHPIDVPDRRLDRNYLNNLVGNPYETTLAGASLILSGAVARYPDLMVCLSHAGGALPFVIGRLQRGYDTSRPGVDTGAEPPRAAVRRLWFDSIAHDPACLRLVAEIAGEDRILLGSDLPFPMGDPDPMASLAAASASLPGLVVGPNTAALLAHLRRALHEIDI